MGTGTEEASGRIYSYRRIDMFYLEHEQGSSLDRHGRVLYQSLDTQVDITTPQAFQNNALHTSRFTMVLTHDVDYVYFSPQQKKKYLKKIVSQARFNYIPKLFVGQDNINNPLLNTKKIIDLENAYGATSTFFVMASTDEDSRYDVQNTRELLDLLQANNREVGLHGSYSSYADSEQLKIEKFNLEAVLGKKVVGIRQHYLRFNRSTWQAQAEAGFLYDATLGYADRIGFRNGMAHPFHAFDRENRPLPLIAIPLAIMDVSLSGPVYMNIPFTPTIEVAWDACKEVLDEVRRVRGCMSILWHPDQFDDVLHPNSMTLYERILQYGAEHDAWMTSGSEYLRSLSNHEMKSV